MKKYVLTGTSGSGKTKIMKVLALRGYYTIPEAAFYLKKRMEREGILYPEREREKFQRCILRLQLKWEREIPEGVDEAFFDRGIPDGLAYFRLEKREPFKELVEESKKKRYDLVFHVGLIMDKDGKPANKKISLPEAMALDELHPTIYKELGHEVIYVASGNVSERASFILEEIEKWKRLRL